MSKSRTRAVMHIFASQAGQILQIAQTAEGGVKGLATQVGGLALRFAPLIAVTAVAGVAFDRWHDSLNKGEPMKAYAATLGLSQKEMEKLKDVSITNTDLIAGAWKTMSDSFGLATKGKKLIDYLFAPTDAQQIGGFIASIYGAFVGSYHAIVATWRLFPGALADLVIQGVNKAAEAATWLINKTIDGLNMLGLNIAHIDYHPLTNAFAGQAHAVAETFTSEVAAATARANGAIKGVFSTIAANAAAAARDRLKHQVDELRGDGKAADASKAHKKAVDEEAKAAKFAAEMDVLRANNAGELRKELDKLKEAGRQPIGDTKSLPDNLREVMNQADADRVAMINKALEDQANLWADIARNADEAASNMERSFGRVSGAIGGIVVALAEYGKEQNRINAAVEAGTMDQAEARKKSFDNQLSGMIGLTDAAKNLFKEHSAGYRAMEAAEKALTIIQLARTAVAVAEGAAQMFATAGPAGFALVAAMLGVMAAVGFGGGSSVSGKDYTKANTGTGTVLGDPEAQSASIKNAIDALKEVDDLSLTVSRDMLSSLRAIESSIGGLASLLVRTGNINASANVVEGFAPNAIGSALGNIPVIGGILKGLFGTKTTVIGSGLYGDAQSLDDILSGGFDASYYSDVKKKKSFLGLTTSTKYKTTYSAADEGIESQFTLLLRQFYETIGKAAGPLGQSLDSVQSKLLGFTVDLGKIDLQGLTGTEIQERLEAVFGAAADSMAEAAVPGLSRFQKVGEGAFETLIRVSSTVEQVDATFQKLGRTTTTLGIDVDMAIAGMFDSVSDFTDAANSYFESFYSAAEQAAAKTAQLAKVFTSLGVAMPDTLAGFRGLVEAQDLTSAAGQQTYATLLQLAPAFADLKKEMDGAKTAADILSERQNLERQLLELTGDTSAIRAADLAKLDASNRTLQEQIYGIQDAQEAAKAAEQLRDAWKSVGDSIMDEVNRIRGLTSAGTGGGFASLLGQFNAANSAARTGDMDAAKNLPQLSKSLLDAAALAATSRQELDRVQAQTAAMLEATYVAIGLGGADTAPTASTGSTLATLSAAQATTTTSSSDGMAEMRQEVANMRADLVSALAQIAGNTSGIKRKLDDVTAASGGDAISVAAA